MHGVRLRDFWRGKMTPRELLVLVKFLPGDSEFMRAAAPDAAEVSAWKTTDYLVAALFDLTARAHFKDPKPLPRPWEAIEQRRRDAARLALLEAQAERVKARQAEGGGV